MNDSHEDDVRSVRKAFETRLEQLLPDGENPGVVYAAMRESTLVPGKRLRPMMLMLAARDMGCSLEHHGLLDLACAIEMVHTASLVLDDMPCMDNAQLRRNQPTIHCQYGESVAILAAVALLSHAFGIISRSSSLSHEARCQAIGELSFAIGHLGLVQGQFLDLNEAHKTENAAAILLTNELKTSSLFNATLQMAATVSNVSPDVRESLYGFAKDMGQAFQLMDDLTDTMDIAGKDPNKDQGKITLVTLLGADRVYQQLREHLRNADRHIVSACRQQSVTRQYMQVWFEKQLALLDQHRPLLQTGGQ
ncbi:TPA: polyprenyl synthetase family protein [Citrobacter freundii]